MESQAKIMVVDDTPANLKLLEDLLRNEGYQVRSFPKGRLALAAAANDPPDLILLDINMPEMTGYEVGEQLKADPKLASIPVIFLSALNDTSDKVHAFRTGGVDYVTKPFQYEEIRARVQTHLRIRGLQAQLERRNGDLLENYEKLRQLEILRDDLTHMIIHDLRSPLTTIICSLDLLRSTANSVLDDKAKTLLEAAERNATNLQETITSILDVSRLETGQMPLRRQIHDLVLLAKAAADGLGPLMRDRSLRLQLASEPIMAFCDSTVITRVIVNLLANAVKFTPAQGTIQVTVESAGQQAKLSVSDTGPGIALEHHRRIFEKFAQVDRSQPVPSTGLGLTFCQLAVAAHGGQIGVTSAIGQGSTFWFFVPAS